MAKAKKAVVTPEILPKEDDVRQHNVIGLVHPFRPQYRVSGKVPAGCTIEEAVNKALKAASLRMAFKRRGIAQVGTKEDGGKTYKWRFVPRHKWNKVKLGPNEILRFRLLPAGGGGGGKGNVLGIVLGVVVAVAAVAASVLTFGALSPLVGATWAGIGAGLAGAAVSTIGGMLVNAIAPVKSPSTRGISDTASTKDDDVYSISAGRNTLDQWQRVPVPVGQGRFAPPKCAADYTSVVGDDQYLHMLFCIGIGDIQVSKLKIGTTPVENFNDVFWEIYTFDPAKPVAPKYYPIGAYEETLNVQLKFNVTHTRTTTECDYCDLDFSLPALYKIDTATGLPAWWYVWLDIRWKAAGETIWNNIAAVKYIYGIDSWRGVCPDDGSSSYAVIGVNQNTGIFIRQGHTAVESGEIKLGVVTFSRTKREEAGYDEWGAYIRKEYVYYNYSFQADRRVPVEYMADGFNVSVNSSPNEAVSGVSVSAGSLTFTGAQGGATGNLPTFSIIHMTTSIVRRSARITFPKRGIYDVSVRRASFDAESSSSEMSDCYWTSLRSFIYGLPVQTSYPVRLLSMRIKATAQLSGTVDTLTLFYQTRCWDYDRATKNWVWRYTSNPAAIFRYLLQQKNAFARAVGDSQLDFESIVEAYKAWDDKGWAYNQVMNGNKSIFERLISVCAAGLASPTMIEGKWGIIVDKPRKTIACAFTSANAWQWQFQKTQIRLPNAIHCNFINENTWVADQRIVFTDEPQTGEYVYETQEYDGVTNPAQIYTLARFHYADAKRRRRTISFRAYDEAILCVRGDLVELSCPSISPQGLQVGRVRRVRYNDDGAVVGFTTDQINITDLSGRRFGVKIYANNGQIYHAEVTPTNRQERAISFLNAQYMEIEKGNQYALGDWNEETFPAIVLGLKWNTDWTCDITCQDYDELIYGNVNAPIPEWQSIITTPIEGKWAISSVPIILEIITNRSVLVQLDNATMPAMVVAYTHPENLDPKAAFVSVEIRKSNTDNWQIVRRDLPLSELRCFIYNLDYHGGYDLRMRYVGKLGEAGPYVTREGIYIEGGDVPPLPVSAIWITGDTVYWEHAGKTPDVIGYQVFMTMDVDDPFAYAKQLSDGYVTDMNFNIAAWRDHARAVWVRAVSSNGLYSEAKAIYVDIGYVPEENIIATMYESCKQGRCWPGKIIEGYKYDDAIYSVTHSPKYMPDELAYLPDIAAYPDPEGSSFVYETTVYVPDGLGVCHLRVQPYFIRGGVRMIEFAKLAFNLPYLVGELTYMPDVCPYRLEKSFEYKPLENMLEVRPGEAYSFRITSIDGILSIMPEIKFIFDVPDATPYHLEDYVLTSEGRLPVPLNYFRWIRDVKFTLQWRTGDTGINVLCVDKGIIKNDGVVEGPLVRIVDINRHITAGVIDATIYGVQYTLDNDTRLNTRSTRINTIRTASAPIPVNVEEYNLEQRVTVLEAQVKGLQTENASLSLSLTSLEAKFKDLDARVYPPDGTTIIVQNGKLVAVPDSRIAELVSQVANLSAANITLSGQIQALQNKDSAFELDITALQNSSTTMQQSIATLQSQNTVMQANISSLQTTAANLQNDLDGLTDRVSDLEDARTELETGLNDVNDDITLINSEITTINGKLVPATTETPGLVQPDGVTLGFNEDGKLVSLVEGTVPAGLEERIQTLEVEAYKPRNYNRRVVLTASGTFTAPVSGTYDVTVIGGGSGAGAVRKAMNGAITYMLRGAAGAYTHKITTLEKGQQVPVVVGKGGAAKFNVGEPAFTGSDAWPETSTSRFGDIYAYRYAEWNSLGRPADCGVSTVPEYISIATKSCNGASPLGGSGIWHYDVTNANKAGFNYGGGGAIQLMDATAGTVQLGPGADGAVILLYYDPAYDGSVDVPDTTLAQDVNALRNELALVKEEAKKPKLYNTELWITQSGEWTAPVDGDYEIWMIGGGSGGLTASIQEPNTTRYRGLACNGSWGAIKEGLVSLAKNEKVNVVIGAGGPNLNITNSSSVNTAQWKSVLGGETSFGELTTASTQFNQSQFLGSFGDGLNSGCYSVLEMYNNAIQSGKPQFYGAGGNAHLDTYQTVQSAAFWSTPGIQGAVRVRFHMPIEAAEEVKENEAADSRGLGHHLNI